MQRGNPGWRSVANSQQRRDTMGSESRPRAASFGALRWYPRVSSSTRTSRTTLRSNPGDDVDPDPVEQIDLVDRAVTRTRLEGQEAQRVVLRRTLDVPIEEVWDACTSAPRITQWLLPIGGDLRHGGTYHLNGNAGGRILRCVAPRLVQATWDLGDIASTAEVELRLASPLDGQTKLHFQHTAVIDPLLWSQLGPGAIGVGWDLSLLRLSLYLGGQPMIDPKMWQASVEALIPRINRAWSAALEAGGTRP